MKNMYTTSNNNRVFAFFKPHLKTASDARHATESPHHIADPTAPKPTPQRRAQAEK